MKDGARERFETFRGNPGLNTREKIDRGTQKIKELRDNIQVQGDSDEW